MSFRITYSVLDADMSELHTQFDAALAAVKQELGKDHPSFILGRAHTAGALLTKTSPIDTTLTLGRFATVAAGEADAILDYAHAAQRKWGKTPWQERARLMRKAADLISERRLRYAAIMALEVGKNRLESLGDVEEAADLLRYYAGQLEDAGGFIRQMGKLSPNEDAKSVLRPWGVFTVIAPFNFPMALAAGMSGAALLGGNAVILKPSEETPWTGNLLFEALRDAGLPDGVLQLAHGTGLDIGRALAEHPRTSGVVFTGSHTVGMGLLRHGVKGSFAKPMFVELGGKNAAIVTRSADLDKAVSGCVRSAFGLSGQKCSALSRIYVDKAIHDEFLTRFIMQAQTLKIGDPTRKDVFLGPVINEKSVERFRKAAAAAKADGNIHMGGVTLEKTPGCERGYFVAPTAVSVPKGHWLERDELFLPFVTVSPTTGLDEALGRMNDSDFGLTGGIFSQDAAELDRFMDEAEAGVLYANRQTGATTGAWPGVQAFCGWKGSGASGKGGCGPYYVSQFMREQAQTRMG